MKKKNATLTWMRHKHTATHIYIDALYRYNNCIL
jgi:hypothetical protein